MTNYKRRDTARRVRSILDEATRIALRHVEARARKILAGENRAHSFCMGMGVASFYDRQGTPLEPDYAFMRKFYEFLDEFDNELKLTGVPMKIESADAPTITDW